MTPRRFPPPWSVEELDACFVVRDHNGQALAEEPCRKRKQALSLLRRSGAARQTFSLSSFLKDENSVSEWPGARDYYEEPLSHCPRRGCARDCRHAGSYEQRLQEQPTCVVRSDVQRTAAHKNRVRLRFGN